MARLAKYPSIANASKSHTPQTIFVNRTRPGQSDGIGFPQRASLQSQGALSYSITWSTRNSSADRIVRPSAVAVSSS